MGWAGLGWLDRESVARETDLVTGEWGEWGAAGWGVPYTVTSGP